MFGAKCDKVVGACSIEKSSAVPTGTHWGAIAPSLGRPARYLILDSDNGGVVAVVEDRHYPPIADADPQVVFGRSGVLNWPLREEGL